MFPHPMNEVFPSQAGAWEGVKGVAHPMNEVFPSQAGAWEGVFLSFHTGSGAWEGVNLWIPAYAGMTIRVIYFCYFFLPVRGLSSLAEESVPLPQLPVKDFPSEEIEISNLPASLGEL